MKYRKGKKGLYYENGKLYECDYNYYNASIWHHYKWALQNTSWDQILDAFKVSFLTILLIPMLPFCGIIHKIMKRRDLKDRYVVNKVFNESFPKDYYEELQ